MDNIEKRNMNEYCRIIEKGNLKTDRAFLALGSLFHRSYYAWGDLVNMINQDYKANFIQVDWPKLEFNPEKVMSQLEDYIDKSGYEEIIIGGLSFGEQVSNMLVETLQINGRDDLLKKIKLQISISGVSSMDNVNAPKLPFIKNRIGNSIYKTLIGCVGKSDRGNYFKKLRWIIGNMGVDHSADISDHKKKLHAKRASLGITPGMVDRYSIMQSYVPSEKLQTSKIVLSGLIDDENTDTDSLLKNLNENANKDLSYNTGDIKESYNVPHGGHAALVEHFNQWEPYLRKALSKVWL